MLIDAIIVLERTLIRWTVRIALLLLALSAVLTFYQVLTRFVLESPSEWTEVASRTAIIWMVYLGIGAALREGAMLSVRILHDALEGTAAAKLLDVLIAGSIVLFLAVAAWYGGQVAWAVRFQTLAGLEVSIGWAYLAIPVGSFVGIVSTVAQTLETRRGKMANSVLSTSATRI